jgi:predicted house-cleaning NTP pyrophosphatase (Maf/HAM1 superfamily)
VFTSELRGSHTNVIGLPLAEVVADLRALEALPRYPPPAFGARSGT